MINKEFTDINKSLRFPSSTNTYKSTIESINQIKIAKLSNILYQRDKTFNCEYNNLSLSMTTPILYKEKNNYELYPYCKIEKNRLVILTYKNKNIDKTNKAYEPIITTTSVNNVNENSLNEVYDVNHPILVLHFSFLSFFITAKKNRFVIIINILSENNIIIKLKSPNNNYEIFFRLLILLTHISHISKGNLNNTFSISLRKNFLTTYYISEAEFTFRAKTGDILLFKGFETQAACQRCVTKSQYDHVALLYKKRGCLYVYESTSTDGCIRRLWREFIVYFWYLLYEKITYRELRINNEKEKDTIINNITLKAEEFYTETKGKEYQLNLGDIACGSNTIKDKGKQNEKGYTCSSLVAGAYRNMGIINRTTNIKRILPGDFSVDSELMLSKQFELGPEITIDFTK